MDEGGSLENCSPEESGPWVRILLPPPNQIGKNAFQTIIVGEVAERLKAVGC